ncbi:MAG: amidohydrolase family protein [Pseudomonas sp.]|jgi:predicted TIM-barrel fold metal-dependent hydrolase|uniref:amidohydrolase family protein n=1 Tax=Pseudomonas sp. TaxID=306 RepID=UPI0026247063|nr:amidohydrolase family protein [Pseudomonas sp.]MDB6050830.1 amidohydrolase family protein [Pseudomonas sp.]
MLIDLHAHAPLPGYYNQHPHWGPFFEACDDGDIRLRVGKWVLTLGSPERKAAVRAGNGLKLEEYMARWADPKVRLAGMDAAGQNLQIVSVPSHCYMYWTEAEYAVPYARTVNDTFAEYCSAAPDRLMFWAHAPLNSPKEAAIELHRACTQLGAKGLSAGGANFGGLEFDSPELDPVWKVLCDLDLPMFIHGYNQSVTWGDRANEDRYETTAIVGMQYDETRCFWNLICGGVLDRFPNLKVYITHGGGYVPYQLGRLAQTNKNLDVVHNKRPVLDYMKNFYFDVELHELPMRQALIEVVGADQMLYGSNFGGSDAVRHDLTDGLRISDADLQKIRWQNACKLLHLDPAKIGQVTPSKVAV